MRWENFLHRRILVIDFFIIFWVRDGGRKAWHTSCSARILGPFIDFSRLTLCVETDEQRGTQLCSAGNIR